VAPDTACIPVERNRIPHQRIVVDMNTTTITNRLGPAAALLIGSALALAPIAAHSSETVAAPAILIVPSGPDIALSAADNLRQAIEADREAAVVQDAAGPTLRQRIEADRAAEVATTPPAPTGRSAPTLRQLIEADRAADVPPGTAAPTLRQQMEADRAADVSPRTAAPTLRQLIEADRG